MHHETWQRFTPFPEVVESTERAGIEPTSPAGRRDDSRFEDGGDHQAPFTLPNENGTSADRFATALKPGLNVFDQRVEIGELTRLQLGMKKDSIDTYFKRDATGRHQPERTDALLELQNPNRQTGGFRLVVSGGAIFDGDLGLQERWRCSFPGKNLPACRACVNVARSTWKAGSP